MLQDAELTQVSIQCALTGRGAELWCAVDSISARWQQQREGVVGASSTGIVWLFVALNTKAGGGVQARYANLKSLDLYECQVTKLKDYRDKVLLLFSDKLSQAAACLLLIRLRIYKKLL